MTRLTDDELIELFDKQLPDLLERRPELEPRIYRAFMKAFATKEEVAAVLVELRDFRAEFGQFRNNVEQFQDEFGQFRAEVERRFERVGQQAEEFRTEVERRFERVEQQAEEFRAEVERRFERVEQQAEEFRTEVREQFKQVDRRSARLEKRIDNLEERVEAGFLDTQRAIDRLGSRWGIRNESIFRQTMTELLEKSFGLHVEKRVIQGEQFDCVIFDDQHILVEISASVGPKIQDRLERKRCLYTEATGVAPARVILVTASIHSLRAQSLREAGFEVIEPEEDKLVG